MTFDASAAIRKAQAEAASGYIRPSSIESGFVAIGANQDGGGPSRPNGCAVDLPAGFVLRSDGIYRECDGKDGKRTYKFLCSPIRVLALPRDRAGEGWGRLVEISDPDGGLHRWAIPAELFAGDGADLRREAFRLGLTLSSEPGSRNAFADLLQHWTPRARVLTTQRLGWTDENCCAFTCGDGRVIGAADVVYMNENAPSAAAEMKAVGTQEGWRETVSQSCAGNPLLVVGVSLAFAGPLLELLGLDGGGLHLRGASSRGKSTIQRVAVSVWGSPAFLHSWRATANGLEGVATACNSSLLALDEIGEIDGREAGRVVYMLANGVGKARADRTGRARASTRWRTLILSSGEISLADKVAEAGGRVAAGQAVRLLDISADSRAYGAFDDLNGEQDGAAFADKLKRATAENHGWAGPALVEAILAEKGTFASGIRAAIASFSESAALRFTLSKEGQVARAVARFALIAAAGEAATHFGLTGWSPGAARDAAMEILGSWLDGRGGSGSAEASEAVARVRAFLVAHGASRFEEIGGDTNQRFIINRAGWRQGSDFLIAKDAWSEIHAGADPVRAASYLAKAGFLERGDGKNLAKKAPTSIKGRPRVYRISAEIMGAGDD